MSQTPETPAPVGPEDWGDEPPPTEAELAAAAALRDVLDGAASSPDAALAAALRNAHAPSDIDPARHEQIIAEASSRLEQRGRVLWFRARVAVPATALLAAAAAFALYLRRPPQLPPAQLALSRSTQELFAEPFPREGGASNRIDRIARARGHELRENRFARWGVR